MEGDEGEKHDGSDKKSIFDYQDEIIKKTTENQIVVITGETGCGKTTKVPLMILESAKHDNNCKILVTQPRRVAAISNANQVAEGLKCQLGSRVGYRIARDKTCSDNTRLTFCTTAIITQLAISKKNLNFASHIILDEVHERDVEMDFLMILIKSLLQREPSCKTKIIMMSATLQAEKFAEFFKSVQRGSQHVPIIKLNLARRFKLKIVYLPTHFAQAELEEPGIPDGLYKEAAKKLVEQIKLGQSILVFLPGIKEIHAMENALQTKDLKAHPYHLTIMHSSISAEHQQAAFANADGKPKVILATNVAESSITLPAVNSVIDFCLTKFIAIQKTSGLPTLQLHWCSKANAEQRAGRTGRLADGKVWRFIHKEFFDKLEAHNNPDMVRVPLESIILRIKLLKENPAEFFNRAMDVPPQCNVSRAILILKELGAIKWITPQNSDPTDGELSKCGRVMASLPLPIHLSKLITLGFAFSLLDETVIIAACMSITGIIRNNGKQTLDDYTTKMIYADGSPCDFIISLNAYNFWKHHQDTTGTTQLEQQWYLKHGLDRKKLLEASALIVEIKERLHKFGMIQSESSSWELAEKRLILQFIIAGALYPYYFNCGAMDEKMETIVHKKAHWCDPRNIISMKFKTPEVAQFGELYQDELKDQLVKSGICATMAEIEMEFYKTGETGGADKVNIQFRGNSHLLDITTSSMTSIANNFKSNDAFSPLGEINPSVVKAIKARLLRQHFTITVMQNDHELAYDHGIAEQLKSGRFIRAPWKVLSLPQKCIFPSKWTQTLQGRVSYILNCDKFYIQTQDAHRRIGGFNEMCKTYQLVRINNAQSLRKSPIAFSVHNNQWKRVKVLSITSTSAVCFMVDFGQTVTLSLDKLFRLADEEVMNYVLQHPPQCFEARLNALKPSFTTSPRAVWRREAAEIFSNWLPDNGKVTVTVHSFINNIASVELSSRSVTISDKLITQGYARWQQESFPRIHNELERDICRKHEPPKDEFNLLVDTINNNMIIPQAPWNQRHTEVQIEGPFSELEVNSPTRILHSFPTNSKVSEGSINCPLFTDNPSNLYGRALVAANVSDKGSLQGAFLQETSLMPAIPGIELLISLTFAPQAALVCDDTQTRYDCALFGLGANVKQKPAFELHDYILPVTIQLEPEDFTTIYMLRHLISTLMEGIADGSVKEEFTNNSYPTNIKEDIKRTVMKIVSKERVLLPPRIPPATLTWPTPACKGPNELVTDDFESLTYPPLATPPSLKKLDGEYASKLRAELKQYLDKIKQDSNIPHHNTERFYKCPLCNRCFDECSGAENHNATKMHLSRLEDLNKP